MQWHCVDLQQPCTAINNVLLRWFSPFCMDTVSLCDNAVLLLHCLTLCVSLFICERLLYKHQHPEHDATSCFIHGLFFNLITRHQALLDSPGLYLVTENGESVKTRVRAGEGTRWWQKSLPELLSRPLGCLFPEGVCSHILQRFLRQTTWLPQFLIFWKKIMRS